MTLAVLMIVVAVQGLLLISLLRLRYQRKRKMQSSEIEGRLRRSLFRFHTY